LTELLQTEAEAFHQELDSMRETNETRQEKMLQKARELKAVREQERQKFVEQALDKKFREESEELREFKSKELIKKYQLEQINQMKEREDKLAKDKEGK
jgi:DNA polymerase III delta prime subunit